MATRSQTAILVIVSSLLARSVANAADVCEDAFVGGQKLAKAHRLLEARAALKQCLQSACPASTRDDCSQVLADVDAGIPTVVFSASIDGTIATNVSVAVGGKTIASKLDGIPVEIDPGAYTFVFTTSDGRSATIDQTIFAAKKNQDVKAEIAGTKSAPVPQSAQIAPASQAASLPPSPAHDEAGSSQRTIGLVTAGVGGVVAILGGVVFFGGKAAYHDVATRCPNGTGSGGCENAATEGDDANKKERTGAIVAAVGGAVLIGGAVLWLTAPRATTPAHVAVGPGEVRLVVRF